MACFLKKLWEFVRPEPSRPAGQSHRRRLAVGVLALLPRIFLPRGKTPTLRPYAGAFKLCA
jgi:hypothetical protein